MIIAIAGLKGGIGKTLVSVHLAGEALARGSRVLLADADPQRSALTWADVAAEAGQPSPTVIGVPASLHKQIPPLAAAHDVTIIDCPPRGDAMTRAAMMVADVVVLPTGPAPTDFWALSGSVAVVQEAQALRPDLRAVLVLNRLQPRQNLSASARAALEGFGLPVLASSLGMRTAYAESLACGMSVTAHSPGSSAALEVRALYSEILATIAGEGASHAA
jgi:chromosome partitioning protein